MKPPDKIDLAIVQFPSPSEIVTALGKILSSDTPSDKESDGVNSDNVTMLSKALVAIANQSWRISSAVLDTESKEPKSELTAQDLKKIGNTLEGMIETLASLGIKVVDRLGEQFNAGLPDQVVTEEPREGISKEQIIRTIRPTIMWHQTMVQRGEIDIAIPAVKK
jgi:hypothetical protein